MKVEIIKGSKVGKLTIVSEAGRRRLPCGQINRFILCKCECGNMKEVRLLHLVRNRISSCGCKKRTRGGNGNQLLCKVWRQMKARCLESYFERHLYFDKGITVSEDWVNSFDNFMRWSISNGYCKGLQIDRKDNSKGYNEGNCRWVTSKVNNNNRDNTFFVTYNGTKIAFCILLDEIDRVNDMNTIRRRIKRGWSCQNAVDTPIRIGNYKRKNNPLQNPN